MPRYSPTNLGISKLRLKVPGTYRGWRCQAPWVVVGLLLAGCGGEDPAVVTISAASSLTEAAEQLEVELEAQHPGIDIRLNLGGTTGLVAQIDEGAPVDILLAADEFAIEADDPASRERGALATNQLVLVTPSDRPLDPTELDDPALRVVACDPVVPCGRLTERFLDTAPLAPLAITADSLEQNVRLVRQRVVSGEADLGIVYRTDARDQDLHVIELDLDNADIVRNTITAVRLTDTPDARLIMSTILDGATVRSITDQLGFGGQ